MAEEKYSRKSFDKNDDDILAHIVKTADGGRVWKTINEGASTSQQKFLVREMVLGLFNEATGHDCNRKQLRTKFERLKAKKKKEADARRLQETQFTQDLARQRVEDLDLQTYLPMMEILSLVLILSL